MADGPDPAFVAAVTGANVPPQGGSAPTSDGPDPAFVAAVTGATGRSGQSSPPGTSAVPVHHTPRPATNFQRAGAPPVAGTVPPEPSWGEVGSQALHNLPSSGMGVVNSLVGAVTHPADTVHGIAELGRGLWSQAQGAMGVQQDPATKAHTEAVARALEAHYANAYGSVRGFKRAVGTDPVGVALDASTALDGLGAGARTVGMAGTARVLSRAASAVDPVANAVRVATAPARLLSNPVSRGLHAFTSGVPATALKVAKAAGATTDPVLRDTFNAFHNGAAQPLEYMRAVEDATKAVAARQGADYVAGKGNLATRPVDFPNTLQATREAVQQMQTGAAGGWGHADTSAMQEAMRMINDVARRPADATRNIVEADALKQQLYQLGQRAPAGKAANLIQGPLYNGVKADINATDAGYATLMQRYQDGLANIRELKANTGVVGNSPIASRALMRSIKMMGKAGGKNVLDQLAEEDPRIPYMLAGAATAPWSRTGHGLQTAVMELPWMGLAAHNLPAGVAGMAGQLAATSPKLAGKMNYAAGAAGRLGSDIATNPAVKGAYYAGRAGEEADNPQSTPSTPATPSTSDAEAATRMLVAEAGNQPPEGQLAALFTAINRAKASGKSLSEEIARPYAYTAVTQGHANATPDSPVYQRILNEIVTPALAGELEDPTGGMTHYLNPELFRKLYPHKTIPSWAQGEGKRIGDHVFYRADGGRTERASGGKVTSEVRPHLARLLSAVERAKRAETASTKPLLHTPDSAVARALEVANRGI